MKPSVDGSRIPITDDAGALWTIESGWVYRNGTRAAMKATELQWIAPGGQNVPGIYALASNNPKHWWLSSVATNGTVTWTDVGANDPSMAVLPPPTIAGFTVTPLSVPVGSPVVLNATVTNGLPYLDGVQITLPYTHTPPASRPYQIVVTGPGGSITSPSIQVSVLAVVVPPGDSPDGTTIPPAASITKGADVWTLGGPYNNSPTLRIILLNGVAVDAGAILEIKDGVIYTKGSGNWWRWNGSAFIDCGTFDPNVPYVAMVFSYPNPLSLPVGVPTSLGPYVKSGWWSPVFTAFDTPQAMLTAAGMFTQKGEGQISNVTEVDDGHS